jgi:hypothetical protein
MYSHLPQHILVASFRLYRGKPPYPRLERLLLGVWDGKLTARHAGGREVVQAELNAFQGDAKTCGGLKVREVDQS